LRFYTIVLSILVVLTTIMWLPNAALILLLYTFGLGIPIALAVTWLLYWLCLFPLFATWHQGGRARAGGAIVSLALCGALALMPAYFSEGQAELAATAIGSTNFAPREVAAASTLEIRRPRDDESRSRFFADGTLCGIECRSLLLTDKLHWVRMVVQQSNAGSPSGQQPRATFYVGAQGEDCAIPGSPASANQRCVLIRPDNQEPADLVVDYHGGSTKQLSGARDTLYYQWKGWKRVTVSASAADGGQAIYRRTWPKLAILGAPFAVAPKMRQMSSSGYEIVRRDRTFGATTLRDVLAAVGLPVPDDVPGAAVSGTVEPKSWKDGISDEMTRQVIAVLDLTGSETFNEEQSSVISKWVTHARSIQQWTPELIELLRRISSDKRLRSPTFVDQIVARNRDVARALLPNLLMVIREEGLGRDYTVARQVAYKMARLDEDLLVPHRDEIVALLDRDRQTRETLLRVIGRIGIDPLPYLAPFSADLEAKENYPRIHGACYADERWSAVLIPALRTALNVSKKQPPWRLGEYREAILKTLAKLGDRNFVSLELASGRYADGARLWKGIESDLDNHRQRLCSF
jgi:hypothetical protein